MRFWKAGTIAALVIGPVGAIQLTATDAEQVIVNRHVAPLEVHQTVHTGIEPFEQARQVLTLAGGSRLGIGIEEVTAETAKSKKLSSETGVLVTSVEADGPASKGGLKEGDVILEFDGERVRSSSQLRRLIQETPAGRKVAMSVSRDGQRVSLTVEPSTSGSDAFARVFPSLDGTRFQITPRIERFEATPRPPRAPRPPSPPRAFSLPSPSVRVPQLEMFRDRDGFTYSFSRGSLGITTQSLSDQLAKHFGVEGGVLVTDVRENSAAAKAGLRAGDVITKVAGSSIDDSSDLIRAMAQAKGEVTLEIVRDRKTMTLKATIEEPSARPARRII